MKNIPLIIINYIREETKDFVTLGEFEPVRLIAYGTIGLLAMIAGVLILKYFFGIK